MRFIEASPSDPGTANVELNGFDEEIIAHSRWLL